MSPGEAACKGHSAKLQRSSFQLSQTYGPKTMAFNVNGTTLCFPLLSSHDRFADKPKHLIIEILKNVANKLRMANSGTSVSSELNCRHQLTFFVLFSTIGKLFQPSTYRLFTVIQVYSSLVPKVTEVFITRAFNLTSQGVYFLYHRYRFVEARICVLF